MFFFFFLIRKIVHRSLSPNLRSTTKDEDTLLQRIENEDSNKYQHDITQVKKGRERKQMKKEGEEEENTKKEKWKNSSDPIVQNQKKKSSERERERGRDQE